MGCCLINPCANDGCYGGNLTAAALSNNATRAAPFITSSTSGEGRKSALSNGGIVGIAIGSVVGAVIVGIVCFMLFKRHQRRERPNTQQVDASGQPQQMHKGKLGMYMPSTPYQGKFVVVLLLSPLPFQLCVPRQSF